MIYRSTAVETGLTNLPKCAFPNCPKYAVHTHHITYEPEVTKGLCVRHHEEITILNGQQARKYRTKLSNKFRWRLWYRWIRGEKVRRTAKSLEWIQGGRGRHHEKLLDESPVASVLKGEAEQTTPKFGVAAPTSKTKKNVRN